MQTLKTITNMLKGVPRIDGRPNFSKLNATRYGLAAFLKRLEHLLYHNNGHAGAVMTKTAQILFLGEEFQRPPKCKEECPTGGFEDAIILNNHNVKYNHWHQSELVNSAVIAWYEDNIEKEYHFGSKWGGKGYGNNTLSQILTGLDERFRKISPEQEYQFLHNFNSDICPGESIEQTIYQMEETNILLGQIGNGFTKQQMIRRIRMKLAQQGIYRKLLIILEKAKKMEVDTWKKYMEIILKWYNKNLQFGFTGPQAGSAYNAAETSGPVQSREEEEKEEQTQTMMMVLNEKLETMRSN